MGSHANRWLTVSCDDVPRCRVECYRSQRKEEGRFGRVDESTERHDVVEDNRATTLTYGQKIYVHCLERVVYVSRHPDIC